jgi:MFS family permease
MVSSSQTVYPQSGKRQAPTPGTARAALAQADFRRLYVSMFASNIGSWMQTVIIGPYALRLSGNRASFVGWIMMAQLGPLLFLSIPGGALAAKIRNRKLYMINLQVAQIVFALFLCVLASGSHPNKWLIVAGVLGGGISNALNAPISQSVMPEIVGRENISAAVSLGSAQINGSRVIGPVLLAIVSQFLHVSPTMVFAFNAITFITIIWALATITIPGPPERTGSEVVGFASLGLGFAELRVNPVARRTLSIMLFFSFFCLAYVAQFPSIAESLLAVNSKSKSYLILFGVWGLGAMCGSLSMSTVLAHTDKRRIPQILLGGFAVMCALWSLFSSLSPLVYAVLFVLGFCYFGTTTALNTVLQQNLTPRSRPYVLSFWFMCFGGTVPFAGFWAGWMMDSGLGKRSGAIVVLLVAAAGAAILAFFGDLRKLRISAA